MILLLHIIVALAGLAMTSITYFYPSVNKLRACHALLGATLASGTYLVWLNPASLKSTCLSGLVYSGVVLAGTALARQRLQHQHDD